MMPRFFFNVLDGVKQSHIDEVGEELSDRDEAWHLATRYAGELLRDWDGKLQPDSAWRLEVRDEGRHLLYRIMVLSRQEDEPHNS